MEQELASKLEQVLNFYEKNALGNKFQKKRQLKEKMMDKIEEFKKSISREKNKEMEEKFQEISDKLQGLINTNSVENIFEISSEFDKII